MTRAETVEFADFYAATFHRVAAQLYAYLGDHAEAQDLTQEAFCRAFDRWGRVSAYENPGAWVRQVAWNLATSRLRHLQVVKRFLAVHREEHMAPPGPERVDLGRALATLPDNHRLAVVLHHVGQLSTSEIAEQCGVAEGTVRSWLSRGRAHLAEQLVDWDGMVVAPPRGGAEAAVAKAKRRRAARRSVIAAVLAVLVSIPVALLLITRGTEPPIIEPTPQPSHSPSPSPTTGLETRRVVLPDLPAVDVGDVQFVDRDHAWLWAGRVLAVTGDGGRTWRRVTSPPIAGGGTLLLAFDAITATIRVTADGAERPTVYWHTKDGGATFSSYPVERPPAEAVMSQIGRYAMLCPGATGLEDGAWGTACDRHLLVKVGSGPMAKQPPTGTAETRVFESPGGRLWVLDGYRRSRLFLSEDGAQSWREMPWPATEAEASLGFSRDGRQVMAFTFDGTGMWELVGSRWLKREVERDRGTSPILLEDGVWLVRRGGAYFYFKDGVYTAIPGLPATEGFCQALADGTVVVGADDAILLGTGTGMRREWVRITG